MLRCRSASFALPFVAGVLCAQTPVAQREAAAPQVELHNAALRMRVYLPDATKGFYTGVRFDWAGVIGDLQVAGHHLYRPWFTAIDPNVRDFTYTANGLTAGANSAATGPVEEFQTAFGYDTAKVGDTFLKIGVGILRKVEDRPYRFDTRAELIDGGRWTSHATATSVTFTQTLGKAGDRYAYVYTKTLRLGRGSSFTLEHRLHNLGTVALTTPLYDHNFLTVDGGPVRGGTSITVPYQIKPTLQPNAKAVEVHGSRAIYQADLEAQGKVTFGLQGFGSAASDYDFTVAEPRSGISVRMQADRPLVDASVWSIAPVLAVEPFLRVDAPPGGDFRWTYTYTYSVAPRP